MKLTCRSLTIPFARSFRHASAERSETATVWVEAAIDDVVGYGEGCPRTYVTGESVETALRFFDEHAQDIGRSVHDVDSLRAWSEAHTEAIDHHPAAWCAIELAALDVLARRDGVTVDQLLGVGPVADTFQYTAVLGVMREPGFSVLAGQYSRMGFTSYKLKLSGDLELDIANCRSLSALVPDSARIRVDANNVWTRPDDAVAHLRQLPVSLIGIEEPVGVSRWHDMAVVADSLGIPVILDESATRMADVEALDTPSRRWIVNVRVSKMGGLMRSLEVVQAALANNLDVIVGAQVGETSLLTRAALTVATAAAPRLVGHEGAFGTMLLSRDICDPPLMFGAAGRLRWPEYPGAASAGFGVSPDVAPANAATTVPSGSGAG